MSEKSSANLIPIPRILMKLSVLNYFEMQPSFDIKVMVLTYMSHIFETFIEIIIAGKNTTATTI